MKYVNKVAILAEEEGHHPDIYIYYDSVVIELHTHAIKGLHLSADFHMVGEWFAHLFSGDRDNSVSGFCVHTLSE